MYDYRMLRRHLFCFLTTCPQCYMNVIPPSLRRLPLMYEIDRATQSQDLSGRNAKSTAPMNQFKYGVYRIQRLQRLTLQQAQNLSSQEKASGHIHRHISYRGNKIKKRHAKPLARVYTLALTLRGKSMLLALRASSTDP